MDLAVNYLTSTFQKSAWEATPCNTAKNKHLNLPLVVRKKLAEKRKLRRIWQHTHHPDDKRKWNSAARQLKRLLENLKNEGIQDYLENLSPNESTDYSLWKATKRLKRPLLQIPPIHKPDGSWARSNTEKSQPFAEHLVNVFQPEASKNVSFDEEVQRYLHSPLQLTLPIKPFKVNEIKEIILYNLKSKKAPGIDLLSGKIIKELPYKGVVLITYIFNAMLRLEYFPLL